MDSAILTKPQQRQHWYLIHVSECPICGMTKEERERVYGEPPKDDADRYDFMIDPCMGHFL